ncbi:hypothetical protein E1B28_001953 [Marasmius oreades]|uniref:EthD domain-containing protein n=1 Tax=Marasmius oreades TaxID=181124 RepID=A0A9P7V4M8_9AGAR|nr:uncharacterized protein E1B28_001953 [Marasmius oreades]KAG7100174.1 hypothetical protein E1B28_001953 [Marasmius oreades]
MSSTIRTDRVKLLIFIKKRKDMSVDEFEKYWLKEHSRVYSSFVEGKKEPLVYEQMHINHEEKEKMKALGWPILDYDGVVAFEAKSFESLEGLLDGDEYVKTVIPDELKFTTREAALVVKLRIASIVPHTEKKVPLPETELKKNRARMMYAFDTKEGMTDEDMRKAWMEGHVAAMWSTPIGKQVIKYEQLYIAEPIVGLPNAEGAPPPKWAGIALMDVPSFEAVKEPETARILSGDTAKWQDPASQVCLPLNIATIIDREMTENVLTQ